MTAHFEIVQTDHTQPWHARWVANNGEIVWTTETYARKTDAQTAIFMLAGGRVENGDMVGSLEPTYPITYIDERTTPVETEPLF